MHYETSRNRKSRSPDVDLLDRETRIQSPPVAQVSLPVPTNLAGYDPVAVYVRAGRACPPAYDWRGQR